MKKSPSKLLIFAEYFYPSQRNDAYYFTKLAIRLSSEFPGLTHLFCATPENPEMASPEYPANLQIHRVDNGKGDTRNLVSRIIKFIRISGKFFLHAVFHAKKNDIVFTVTNPAFNIPLLAFLKKIKGYRYIVLAYDIFPENLVATGLAGERSLSYRICKKIFDWGYCQADYVISIGRDMTEILEKKGIASDKIVLLPNWANTDTIVPASKKGNSIVERYEITDSRIFMFAGNIGRAQGVPEFLQVIKNVSSENAAFLFIGEGAMLKDLIDFQSNHPEKKLFHNPRLPMSEQNTFLNACDIAVVTLSPNMYGIGIPSKSYYSLASGHPILYIGDKKSEVALMLKDAQCGWQVDSGDIEGCVKAIESICAMPEQELQAMGQRARAYIETHGSEKIMLNKYSFFFKTLYEK